jgi:acetyl-CoA C-acetyltransferase
MNIEDPIVIVGAVRTPMGVLQGDLASLSAPQLGAFAIRGAVERSGLKPDDIEDVIMGCVLPAGQGQAPARQASRSAGIPDSAGCTTVNKMCGSGMKAAMFAHDLLLAGTNRVMVAGGMESMSNAPYLLEKARQGYRMGHGKLVDHMFLDGLEDAYDRGRLMGTFAEDTAEAYDLTRTAQDAFALTSLERALKASTDGTFAREISPVFLEGRKGDTVVDTDEQPGKAQPAKIPTLKPAFRTGGTVTAANSSSISDGAAALVMMRRSEAEKRGLNVLATVLAHNTFAHQPSLFTTAPVGAIKGLLEKVDWRTDQVDLWEINEAFAVVPLVAMRDLQLPHDRVNIHGGACALGHPIGASGARIVVTLLNALKTHGQKRGVAAVCLGGGEATAVALELA